ncbi:replication protein [Providencia rustigianii]|uniref:replication protein n=1 Tax=Providencia rustigianii TaxID=158850 RepID=UPI000D8326BC|nr:replication protein [Providencia rustigianii]SPY78199.1 phage replication protein O, N-terminal domain [Providencia rustigianii]
MKSNVAYVEFGNQRRLTEVKVNDCDDFIKTPRQVKKYMMSISNQYLTYRQYRIIDALIEKTCGWHKDFDRITNTQIAEMINLHHTHVSKEICELVERKILIKQGNKIGVNKNINEWILEFSRNSQTLAKPANKSLAKTAKEDKPNQLNTIDTYSIDNINNNTPLTPQEGNGENADKPKKRTPVRINYQEYLDVYNEEVGDSLPHATVLNDKRKRRFKKLIPKLATPNADGWRAYVRAFVRMAKPWYFGDNPNGWSADIDHLLKEDTLTAVREGKPSLTGR